MAVSIEVKCDDATHIYWREVGTSNWDQLTTSASGAPTIEAPDSQTTTFSFSQFSGSNHDLVFKESAGGSEQSLPASVELDPDEQQLVYFSKDDTTKRWYAGYVKVPPNAK